MSATTPVAPGIVSPPARPARPARHRTGFWLVGFVFLVTLAFSAVPAPLYVLYAARDRFGPLMITVIFAAYAVGVIASLFLAGHLSDWLGRRRMAVIAVAGPGTGRNGSRSPSGTVRRSMPPARPRRPSSPCSASSRRRLPGSSPGRCTTHRTPWPGRPRSPCSAPRR
jgi:hypothetical protein